MPPGASDRFTSPVGTLSAGQGCQRRSGPLMLCPIGRSLAATRTSVVLAVTAWTGAGGSPLLIMYVAAPPVRIASARTARRAGFMKVESERDGVFVEAGFQQGMVKTWLSTRVKRVRRTSAR